MRVILTLDRDILRKFHWLIFTLFIFFISSCTLIRVQPKNKKIQGQDLRYSQGYQSETSSQNGDHLTSLIQDSNDTDAPQGQGQIDGEDLSKFTSETTDQQVEEMQKNMQEALDERFLINEDEKNRVHYWLEYYTQGEREKDRLTRHMANGERYRKVVEGIFEEHRLPKDLYFIGLIESGFHLTIKSRAKAVGPWQFMEGTAKRYGLQVNSFVDERRSIFKSTHAAALYLKDLFNIFGDWRLALSAYNSGEYKVLNAIRSGKTRDFKELSAMRLLPRETRDYLPKLIAARKLSMQFAEKGLLQEYMNTLEPEEASYPVDHQSYYVLTFNTSVEKLERVGKITSQKLKTYNPDIKHSFIPASQQKPFKIYLPDQEIQVLAANLQNAPTTLLAESSFHWKGNGSGHEGEERGSRGRKTKRKLREKNRQEREKDEKTKLASQNNKFKSYIVRKGDSLHKIAERFNVSLKQLMIVNSLESKRIFPKQRILIPI